MLEAAGTVNLGEKGRVGPLLGILGTGYFKVGDLYGNILRKGYLKGVFKGKDQRGVIGRRGVFRILSICCRREAEQKRNQ